MWTVPIDIIVACIFSFAIIGIVSFSFFYEVIDEGAYLKYSMQVLFYCTKCNHIYSLNGNQEYCECPNCSTKNIRLKF